MTAAPFIHIEPQRLHRPYRLHKVFGVFGTPKRARTREIPPPLPIRAAFLLPTRRHVAALPPICHETLFVYNFIDRRKKCLKIEMAAFLALLYFMHFLLALRTPPPPYAHLCPASECFRCLLSLPFYTALYLCAVGELKILNIFCADRLGYFLQLIG